MFGDALTSRDDEEVFGDFSAIFGPKRYDNSVCCCERWRNSYLNDQQIKQVSANSLRTFLSFDFKLIKEIQSHNNKSLARSFEKDILFVRQCFDKSITLSIGFMNLTRVSLQAVGCCRIRPRGQKKTRATWRNPVGTHDRGKISHAMTVVQQECHINILKKHFDTLRIRSYQFIRTYQFSFILLECKTFYLIT